jgi:hypothetical protein
MRHPLDPSYLHRCYPHAVKLSSSVRRISDVEGWLLLNVPSQDYHYDAYMAPWWWCFRHQTDAFAFKMRWV